MSHSHKQSWLARQVKEWWGFGFPGVTEKWGPSMYKGEREHPLDWFVSYWSNEISTCFQKRRSWGKIHQPQTFLEDSTKIENLIFLTNPTLMCFLSDHLCRPIFAEPFISDHLGQVICPFGPCLLLIPYVNVACFHCPACAAMLMVQVQEVTSTRRLMARFKTSLIWTKDKLWDILHTTSDIWVVNRWGCVKNRKVSPPTLP